MAETLEEAPLLDWGAWADEDDLMPSQLMTNIAIALDAGDTSDAFEEAYSQIVASGEEALDDVQQQMMADFLNAVSDAAQSGELEYGDIAGFTFWLEYNMHQPSIPNDADFASVISQWIDQYAATHDLPVPAGTITPSPIVQQAIESANAASPLPNPPATPPTLSYPTPGIQSAAAASAQGTPVTISGGSPDSVTPAEATDALATLFVESMQVLARVIDAMLPGMAPGQVPEALSQLNKAVDTLEHQVAGLLTDVDVNVKGSMAAQLNGALQTLNGLAQEVNILAEDVAMKASSTIGDDVNKNTAGIAALGATVAGITATALPALEAKLAAAAAATTALQDQVNNDVVPELNNTTAEAKATTAELSGTDKDCLDQLCDAINNVTNPVEEGGATPSLLKQLGNLLTKALEIGALMSLVETLMTLADINLVLNAVVSDTETMANWATQAANVIVSDFSWSGPLNITGVTSD
jgi:uncharacterized protein YoxC